MNFGASVESADSSLEIVQASAHSLHAYVYNNASCIDSSNYDAKNRKIRRLALSETADDATNKRYVKSVVDVLRAHANVLESVDVARREQIEKLDDRLKKVTN